MPVECLKCGAALEPRATGRPPTYCGPVCRRAAEFELRRLQRRLEVAEREVKDARETVEFSNYGGSPAYRRKRLRYAEQHLAELELRLAGPPQRPGGEGEPK